MIPLLAILSAPIQSADEVFDPIAHPDVEWVAVRPLLILVLAAMGLMLVTALTRKKVFDGFYPLVTSVAAIAAAVTTWPLWERVQDADRGPFTAMGGALGVDGFSLFLTVVICSSVVIASLLADGYLRREEMDGPDLYVLLLLSASGGILMASADDLIVLFLGLEVLSLAVYVLAAMHLRRVTSQEAGIKYFVLGSFASAFLLYGIALTYGATGSTNLVEILDYLSTTILFDNGLLMAGMALLLVGLGFKVAAAPFHSWTPDVYQGSPTPVVAYMASGVKAAGFAGLIRVFYLGFATYRVDWQPIIYAIAILTLLVGSIMAVVQTDVKRMLAYSSINHAGFILMAVQAANERGIQATLFYLASYTFLVGGSFGIIAVVGRKGDDKHSLDDYRGLARSRPGLALVFSILLFSQAGRAVHQRVLRQVLRHLGGRRRPLVSARRRRHAHRGRSPPSCTCGSRCPCGWPTSTMTPSRPAGASRCRSAPPSPSSSASPSRSASGCSPTCSAVRPPTPPRSWSSSRTDTPALTPPFWPHVLRPARGCRGTRTGEIVRKLRGCFDVVPTRGVDAGSYSTPRRRPPRCASP